MDEPVQNSGNAQLPHSLTIWLRNFHSPS
jgi:hypothetical protein